MADARLTEAIAWTWRWPALDIELHVHTDVAEIFRRHRQGKWFGNERGGQLFVDANQAQGLYLALATKPHPRDRATRMSLELDPTRCATEIRSANLAGLRLVGYWHTHPEPEPLYSSVDIEAFRRFAERYADQLPRPLAVIVGWSDHVNGTGAWLMSEQGPFQAICQGRHPT